MEEATIISQLREFVSGDTLVWLYMAISITRFVLIPLYKGSKTIKGFVSAATEALQSSNQGHLAIAIELKALNEILKLEKQTTMQKDS